MSHHRWTDDCKVFTLTHLPRQDHVNFIRTDERFSRAASLSMQPLPQPLPPRRPLVKNLIRRGRRCQVSHRAQACGTVFEMQEDLLVALARELARGIRLQCAASRARIIRVRHGTTRDEMTKQRHPLQGAARHLNVRGIVAQACRLRSVECSWALTLESPAAWPWSGP